MKIIPNWLFMPGGSPIIWQRTRPLAGFQACWQISSSRRPTWLFRLTQKCLSIYDFQLTHSGFWWILMNSAGFWIMDGDHLQVTLIFFRTPYFHGALKCCWVNVLVLVNLQRFLLPMLCSDGIPEEMRGLCRCAALSMGDHGGMLTIPPIKMVSWVMVYYCEPPIKIMVPCKPHQIRHIFGFALIEMEPKNHMVSTNVWQLCCATPFGNIPNVTRKAMDQKLDTLTTAYRCLLISPIQNRSSYLYIYIYIYVYM